ncbi:hypothetical protein [Oleiagrimonas sp. C23AA]|uniref:hypothetical protein n=1 Tax=Oleiagrimonas sp. C23AA TaxID=2719047 RepID=UPI00141F0942|nr:hypothetical protein [Oleiagrimonas sp. C23AA]NII09679.1 hypothetical protein [Oleiagrimonas sp. C23AA]
MLSIRNLLAGGACLLAATLLSGCMPSTTRQMQQARVDAHHSPLQLSAEHGKTHASIAVDGSVIIDKKPLPLTAQQRAATLAYRKVAMHVVDLSLDSATHVVRYAIPHVLFDLVFHGAESAGDREEARAKAAIFTPDFCSALGQLQQQRQTLVAQVPQLAPYSDQHSDHLDECQSHGATTVASR